MDWNVHPVTSVLLFAGVWTNVESFTTAVQWFKFYYSTEPCAVKCVGRNQFYSCTYSGKLMNTQHFVSVNEILCRHAHEVSSHSHNLPGTWKKGIYSVKMHPTFMKPCFCLDDVSMEAELSSMLFLLCFWKEGVAVDRQVSCDPQIAKIQSMYIIHSF